MLTNQKKSGTLVVSNCRAENITRQKNNYFLMIKESIYHDKRTNLNVYAPNNRASQHIKQKLIKLQEEIGKLAVTARDFNIPLSIIDRTRIQKSVRI